MLAKDLLDILACPVCKSNLKYEPEKNTLTCLDEQRETREFKKGERCGLIYRIEDDIPIMLEEEATKPVA